MTYRVFYPLITRDSCADFASKTEAEAFATAKRNAIIASPMLPSEAWHRVEIVEINQESNQ